MKRLLRISLALVAALGAFAAQAQDVKAGEKKIAMCIGCHGIPGYQASFPEVHKVPMIAGQNAKYIVAALQAYAKGERKHPTMQGIAGSLSDADMANIAAYYEQQAKLPAVPETIPDAPANVAELVKKGACVSCHGANFSKPIDPSYPKLAGQHGDYLAVALKAYKTENSHTVGRGNAIMAGQVKQFSNAELKVIASYIATLPTELATVPQSKFR
ncbi:c-type cytochrome [Roseateles cellulosilyticus]|uniref:Cytochrome c4 n=1 Tax=Pelomonas cellulosilytica TaxID=2906762 RepID=A0ABS8XPM0_9BURK|nr:c-type cytochrome [Pelomonas sp. P8]MCE4554709.1 cytochrome c4 [Pelomonas sp. P8]